MPKAQGSNEASATVAYDGAAVADGTMDVRDFAPALLAIGDLIHEANALLNGNLASVTVRVKAQFEKGSFLTAIDIHQVVKEAEDLLIGDHYQASHNLLKALIGAKGAFWLIKKLRGKKAVRKEIQPNSVELTVAADKIVLTVSREVADLYEDPVVRTAMREVLRPLEKKGIDRFSVADTQDTTEVSKDEVPYFTPLDAAQEVEEERTSIYETLLLIDSAGFREGLTWRFSDGTNSFTAKIRHQEFLDDVKDGLPFSSGDVLNVRLKRTTEMRADGSLHTENEILEVLGVKRRSRQARFKF